MIEKKELEQKTSQILAATWLDEEFKRRFLADPKTVLNEHGFGIPDDVEVKVVECGEKTYYFPLPQKPEGIDVHVEALNKAARVAADCPCDSATCGRCNSAGGSDCRTGFSKLSGR